MASNYTPVFKTITASWQRLHRLIGFRNGYNFVLWCIFALGLLCFTLSRAPYLDYYGVFCKPKSLAPSFHAAPGECYFFLNGGREQIGMMMHLYGIIPSCFLLFFQFVPIIRRKAVMFHRINGYIIILLMAVAVVGGLMMTRNAFGGDVSFQVANVLLGAIVTICLVLAMVNIKRLQIDEHRSWMLRAWVLVRHRHHLASQLLSRASWATLTTVQTWLTKSLGFEHSYNAHPSERRLSRCQRARVHSHATMCPDRQRRCPAQVRDRAFLARLRGVFHRSTARPAGPRQGRLLRPPDRDQRRNLRRQRGVGLSRALSTRHGRRSICEHAQTILQHRAT